MQSSNMIWHVSWLAVELYAFWNHIIRSLMIKVRQFPCVVCSWRNTELPAGTLLRYHIPKCLRIIQSLLITFPWISPTVTVLYETANQFKVKFNVHGIAHRYMCILYNKRDATYTMLFIIINALHVSGGFSAHHHQPIKLYVQPWVLSCCPAVYRWCGWLEPNHTSGRQQDSTTIPKGCTYSFIGPWWWAEKPPETCRPLIIIKNIVSVVSLGYIKYI